MPRYKIIVAYEGTNFHGWQKQKPAGAIPLRTAQGVLEDAVIRVVSEPVVLTGASRTDAGVHAHGQVAAFTTTRDIPPHKLPRAITAQCPADIQVHAAEVVPDHFDPITHAVDKQYSYHIQHGPVLPPLFDRRTTWRTHHRLDPVPMRVAASLLVGRHDFVAFAQASHGRGSTVREIFHCDVQETGDDRLKIEVRGSGFLYNMVRIIAGTLVEVGRGAFQPEYITSAIESRNRRACGPTLGPQGLCLEWIRHEVPAKKESHGNGTEGNLQ
ncbi:MAG: tRNA pseudouridine(38-40) synthase TruA [Phycisphaerales bacterium]|jgi:tRNA pseudouridine38-40 synthase|nr:tRNA pseudouridine(38-40) synthase TruA [Phycisphaerales bacterium]